MADKVDIYRVSSQGTYDRRETEIDGRFAGLYVLQPRSKTFLNNGAEQGRAYNANGTSLVDMTPANARKFDTWEEFEDYTPDNTNRQQVRRWTCIVSDYSMNPVSVEEGEERTAHAQRAMAQATQLGLLQSLVEAQAQKKSQSSWQPMILAAMAITVVAWVLIWGILLFREQSVRDFVNSQGERVTLFDNPVQYFLGGDDEAPEIVAPPASDPAPAEPEPTAAPAGTATPAPPAELPPKEDDE